MMASMRSTTGGARSSAPRGGGDSARRATAIRLPTSLEDQARAYAGEIGISLNAFTAVAVFSCVAGGVRIAAAPLGDERGGPSLNENRQLIRLSPGISERVRHLGRDGESFPEIVCRCVAGYVTHLNQIREEVGGTYMGAPFAFPPNCTSSSPMSRAVPQEEQRPREISVWEP